MGWGESVKQAPSASQDLVARAEFRRTAKVLASAVEQHQRFPTTAQYESVLDALADFRKAEAQS